jgi:ACS family glucarate transporter-like MFS transporter
MNKSAFRWIVMFGLVAPVTLLMGIDRGMLAVVAPVIQKDYDLSLAQMSIVLSAFYWAYGPAQFFAGVWVQKVGSRIGLALAATVWSAAILLFPASLAALSLAILMRVVLGLGQAADWPACVQTINSWLPKSEKARASSILLGASYIGQFLSKPVTGWFADVYHWSTTYYIFGIVGVLLACVWYNLHRNSPDEHPRVNAAERSFIVDGRQGDGKVVRKTTWNDVRQFAGKIQFWAIGLQYVLLITIQQFYNIYLPTYLMNTRQLSLTKLGVMSGLPWVGMISGVILMGAAQDFIYKRTRNVLYTRVPLAVSGFCMAGAGMYLASMTEPLAGVIAFLTLSMFGIGTTQVCVWSACQDLGGSRSATLAGWTSGCAIGGTLLCPALVVWLVGADNDWATALAAMSIVPALLGCLTWLLIRPDRPLILADAPAEERKAGP